MNRFLSFASICLVSLSTFAYADGKVTIIHPTEGMRLPALTQVFAFGEVTPGSTLTVNGTSVAVHSSGAYFTMVPLKAGDNTLSLVASIPDGSQAKAERHFTVADIFHALPPKPLAIERGSIEPADDVWLAPGDSIRVYFQGSPDSIAEFSIHGVARTVPMTEITRNVMTASTSTVALGLYEGTYVIQPNDKVKDAEIEVVLHTGKELVKAKAHGRITIDAGAVPRTGIVSDDIVAIRPSPSGGYDMFLYKGMRVRLTGKWGGEWRVRLSSLQSGWVKESAIRELAPGSGARTSILPNITVSNQEENTIVRMSLSEMLPYRVEQSLDPMQLVITFYGAINRTELIRFDPLDPLIREVHWRQIAPDVCQVVITPKFKKWWGFDTRYEGTTFVAEIRKPWSSPDIRGMVIAIDAGHGGNDRGAVGPHGTMEKEANLQIARVVKDALEKAGAKPFLTREKDIDVALYDRPKIAWNQNARLFVSVHCNAAGVGENPLLQNGFSIYFYQPQSMALAEAVHARYSKTLSLADHGLYYADFAVCRMTQMPAILTEQAYITLPDQEQLIFDPDFQHEVANSIVRGIKDFVAPLREP